VDGQTRGMRLTDEQLNRATLDRQLLLRRERIDVAEAVRRIGFLQAQEPAWPYVALWNRVDDLDPAAVDAAFTEGVLVRSSLLRLTLHAVHVDDHPAFHQAMVPSLRGSRLGDRRLTDTGLTASDIDAVLPALVAFLAEAHTTVEIERFLAERLGRDEPRAWWAMRMFAPVHHVPIGGPWSFRSRGAYRAAPAVLDPDRRDEAVRHLVRRAIECFGPLTARDIAQFTILRAPVVKGALDALGDELVQHEGPTGGVVFDVADGTIPDADSPAPPRLLGMWDSTLLAFSDRSRVIPDDWRPRVVRRNGDVLPTVLVDGHVAGVWRLGDGRVEVTAFEYLDAATWAALAGEAESLTRFVVGRDPNLSGRYGHWWAKGIPAVDTRVV
jgi:hypothetical protein